MVVIYSSSTAGNLTVERTQSINGDTKPMCILRVQKNGYYTPIFKASLGKLIYFLGDFDNSYHRNARLDESDTKVIIKNIVGDALTSAYKPSSVMYYNFKATCNDSYDTITLTFDVYFQLWKKVNDTFKDYVTDTLTYTFTLTVEEYMKLLTLITVSDGTVGKKIVANI